jgi:surface-anchored protein
MKTNVKVLRAVLGAAVLMSGSAAFGVVTPLLPDYVVLSGTVGPAGAIEAPDVDLELKLHEGELEWKVHKHEEEHARGPVPQGDEHDEDLEPHGVVFFVHPSSAFVRPTSSVWDFTGVPAGGEVIRLPQAPNPELPYVGWGTEDIAAGIFSGDSLTVKLLSVTGGPNGTDAAPGVFSVWQGGGLPVVKLSSTPGGIDTFTLETGTHTHYNIGFSAPGLYAVTLEASGLTGSPSEPTPLTATGTFYFQVVPEPAVMGVLAPAAALLLRRRK